MVKAINPIIPGFAPDPSVCRAGDDYYLVNSSFAYFPGLPIYHSRDLAHWELIGSALDRTSQLDFGNCGLSRGLFAPTIRYNDGKFYIVCTNIDNGGNFVVTADDIRGPWSDPHWLGKDGAGIDPSLFFDDDGTCWYCGTRDRSEGAQYFGDNEIYLRRLDLKTFKLTGKTYVLWNGALRDAVWSEGPHIYKRGKYYYLVIAEGGTGPNHAVTVARSEKLTQRFEGFRNNPILTHRHLGMDYPVSKVGHADFVEAPDGTWCAVMLASRPVRGVCPLGRETFLAKVTWEDDWPVVNAGIGKLEDIVTLPYGPYPVISEKGVYDFESEKLSPEFMSLRLPIGERASLTAKKGCLRLYASAENIGECASPSYLCVRPRGLDFVCSATFRLYAKEPCECGIVVLQSETHSLRLVRVSYGELDEIRAVTRINNEETVVGSIPFEGDICVMKLEIRDLFARLICGDKVVATDIDVDYLSTEKADGFVGNTAGLYCRSDSSFEKNGTDAPYIDCAFLSVQDLPRAK